MKIFLYLFICSCYLMQCLESIEMKFPTMGYSAYTIVSVSENSKITDFNYLLEFYAKISSTCNDTITHRFYFGTNKFRSITSDNIQPYVEKLISDNSTHNPLYESSIRNSTQIKFNNGPIVELENRIKNEIENENLSYETIFKKKTITLLTDKLNLTHIEEFFGHYNVSDSNSEIFVMTTSAISENIDSLPDYIQVFHVNFENLTNYGLNFCKNVPMTVPDTISSLESGPKSHVYIKDSSQILDIMRSILETVAKGPLVQLVQNEMYANFISLHVANGGDDLEYHLPWLANNTQKFIEHGISNLVLPEQTSNKLLSRAKRIRRDAPKLPSNCKENVEFYQNLVQEMENSTKSSTKSAPSQFFTLYANEVPECLRDLITGRELIKKNFTGDFQTIVSNVDPKDLFNNYIKPLKEFLPHPENFRVVQVPGASEIPQVVTSGYATMASVPILDVTRTVYRESWTLAWEQFFSVIFLCTTSVMVVGAFFYYKRKKLEQEKIEMLRDGESRRSSREFLKTDTALTNRLCWEVHHERVHIDYEFPIGEGNNGVVYLGKLKGKAPIMQWINLTEMKQFQDCAVAVRVPRRFDIEEEKQLEREINAMKAIKHHDYVAVLLGWTNKNNLVCTILELTHTNLLKYITMLKDGVNMDESALACASLIPYKQYLRIIIQVADAMAYIASKGLVHRDISARNVLLTTGLRAKVSGFSFCSLVGDDSFHPSKPAFSWLPLRHMAIEAILDGRFSERSDVWSFGMVLYEMYSLGDEPFANLKPDVFIKLLRNGERPRSPDYASDEIYSIMSKCWYRYPERRPNFNDLKNTFQLILDRQYDNPAFEFEHTE